MAEPELTTYKHSASLGIRSQQRKRAPPPALADSDSVGTSPALWETVCRARPGPASVCGCPATRKRWADRAPGPGGGPEAESPLRCLSATDIQPSSLPLERIRLLLIPWRPRSLQSFHSPHRQTWVPSVSSTTASQPASDCDVPRGWQPHARTADLRGSYFRFCRLPAPRVEVFMFWHLT